MKRIVLFMVLVLCCFGVKGQGWFELGTGSQALNATNTICALCTDKSGNVYAAGRFTDTNTYLQKWYVAKWDAVMHHWSELGTGSNKLNADAPINALCIDKFQNIYAAGDFTDSESYGFAVGYNYVAKWNGSTWSELGTGADGLSATGPINTICVDDSGNVYTAGNFRDTSYGQSYVAKWNGTTWTELFGLNTGSGFIYSICVDDSQGVFASGSFVDTAGFPYVAKWNKATGNWSELGSAFGTAFADIEVRCLQIDSVHNVYAAVNIIDTLSGIFLCNVYKWDGINWNLLGDSANALNANSYIYAICLVDSNIIYATGNFTNSIGKEYVAKYNPQTNHWSEFGTGSNALNANSFIYSLCIDKYDNLYGAGNFTDDSGYNYVAEYGISTLQVTSISANYAINVYPNPVTNNIIISLNPIVVNEIPNYCLYDCIGRLCSTGWLNQNSDTNIDVSELGAGIYFLKINEEVFKIIKK